MTKTSLSPEDVEQIKQSKGKLSAAEVQRRYNIGWGRLQKLWNGTNQEPVTRDVPTTKQGGGREWQWCRVSYVTGASN